MGARPPPGPLKNSSRQITHISDVRQLQVEVTPRQAYASAGCRWRYDYNPFATSALEGGGWSAARPGRFTPRRDLVRIVLESEWTPRQV